LPTRFPSTQNDQAARSQCYHYLHGNILLQCIARIGFAWVKWQSRQGLRATAALTEYDANRLGERGETYAYWYLRRLGYIFIARNYMPLRAKGELDLIGYDGETLAIVEVCTRQALKDHLRNRS
jgi:Uncharacterised protein family UPF0102